MDLLPAKPLDLGQRILGSLTTAILVFDQQLHLTYLNPAGEELFAVSYRQVQGTELQALVVNGNGLLGRVGEALQTGRPFTVRELQLETSSGRQITVDCSVTPFSTTGQAREVIVEMLHLDRQLRINREENLLAQHQAAHDLIRRLAHEIKNPLGGLRGAAQLLERELSEEDLKEYTGIIIGEADRLRNLVDRLLGPNQLPKKRPTNLHKVLEHVCNLLNAEGAEDVSISRDYDPSLPDLMADPDMLIQAVLNVARNAIQAMDGNGELTLRTRVERQTTIGTRRHKMALLLDVIDNGRGIKPEMLATIFYPMVTGREEGTGLGLSIAQSLVHRHGGLIECESKPGQTVFSIILPLESLDE
jgi:two-component system nitrogen regulation sensor histidine kinase GlnL